MIPSTSAATDRRNTKKGRLPGNGTRPATGRAGARGSTKDPGPPVIPGEDVKAYRGRLRAWTGCLAPRNPVERYLVERAVALSWQLDRADRAQIERLAGEPLANPPEGASDEDRGPGRTRPMAFDETEAGERLRRHQLGCGRALSRTLHTFARLRQLGMEEVLASTRGTIGAAPVADDEPALSDLAPDDDTIPTAGVIEILPADVAGALAEILATIDPEDLLLLTDPAILPDPPSAEAAAPRAGDDSEHRGRIPRPPNAPRRRIPAPSRDRQSEWSASRGPSHPGGGPEAPRSCPLRRTRPRPEAVAEPAEGRRRVGGYEVPLEPMISVSCADRAPVRLRREARR